MELIPLKTRARTGFTVKSIFVKFLYPETNARISHQPYQ